MYQPKIRNELITRLYYLAKAQNIPMTRLVNQLLSDAINRLESADGNVGDPLAGDYERNSRRTRRPCR
jgi:hypothetical protein